MSVQTRGRLIEAAKRVFSEKGYHNAQIAHIIDEAGVARGTFYLYFKGKEEILKELLQEVVNELRERIKEVNPYEDPKTQVLENIERVIEFALEERDLARIVLQRNSDPELFGVVEDFFDQVSQMIERSLSRGVLMGVIRECNTGLVARAILGAMKEIILGLLEEEDIDVPAVAREILEFSVRGVWKNVGGADHGGDPRL